MNSVVFSFFIFCTVQGHDVTCQQSEDEIHSQRVVVTKDEQERKEVIMDIYREQVQSSVWYSVGQCEAFTDGHAQCISVPLPQAWIDSNE